MSVKLDRVVLLTCGLQFLLQAMTGFRLPSTHSELWHSSITLDSPSTHAVVVWNVVVVDRVVVVVVEVVAKWINKFCYRE